MFLSPQAGKAQERFREEVIAGTGPLAEDRVREIINRMVERDLEQWRSIAEYASFGRQAEYNGKLSLAAPSS